MAKRRTRHHFEPWVARKSRSWEASFRGGPPPVDDPAIIDRWLSMRDRAEERAEVIVWGSGMLVPQVASVLASGEPVVMDDRHIIARFVPIATDKDRAPDHLTLARRAVECVNACEGIGDPGEAIERTREILLDLANGRAGADDPRVAACLARISKNNTRCYDPLAEIPP